MTPSERAGELLLIVRRIRKRTGLDVVPMLVVEGAADEELLSSFCKHDAQQIFAAGSREVVEQLLRHVRSNPIAGCECAYLIDCDGYGKTADLRDERCLLVSESCDMEADLVQLGAALRVTTRFSSSPEEAEALVARARRLALPLSIIRRAAYHCSTPMRRGKSQFRMADFSDLQMLAWDEHPPSSVEVLDVVAGELGWSTQQRSEVEKRMPGVPQDFGRTCLGKDALDALFRLLKQEGNGDVRGWNLAYFYRAVAAALTLKDLDQWEVGRRLRAWEASEGHELMANQSD